MIQKRSILSHRKKNIIVNNDVIKFSTIKFYDKIKFLNLSHASVLINGINLVTQIKDLLQVNEVDGTWMVPMSQPEESEHLYSGFGRLIGDLIKKSLLVVISCLAILLFIVVLYVIGKLLYACIRNRRASNSGALASVRYVPDEANNFKMVDIKTSTKHDYKNENPRYAGIKNNADVVQTERDNVETYESLINETYMIPNNQPKRIVHSSFKKENQNSASLSTLDAFNLNNK